MRKTTYLVYKIINRIIRHTHWYDAYWNGAQKFWNINTFDLDVINLGSGAAVHAFNYSESGVKGMNWALAPQSLVHDFNILRNYFSYLREGAVIIITVCPFSCLYSRYDKKSNFKYYTFLHPATIIDFDNNERTRALTIKLNPFKVMPGMCIKNTIKDLLRVIKHKVIFPHQHIDLEASSDTILNGWKKQFGISDISAPLSEQHLTEQKSRRKTLDEIIEFCKERKLQPIVVIPPMHHTLVEKFTKDFLEHYVYDFLDGINAPIYNNICKYSNDSDFYNTALFLNTKGAKQYTKDLVNILVKDNILVNRRGI